MIKHLFTVLATVAVLATGYFAGTVGRADVTSAGIACTKSRIYDASTSGKTAIIPAGSTQKSICGYTIFAAGTVNVDLEYGTQASTPCDTGAIKLTPAYQLTAQTGIVDASSHYRGMFVPDSNQLCVNSTQAVAVQVIVYYD